MSASVVISNVRKSYGADTVLDGVSLQISAGEALGLIGPSGSGKSTLLRCIAHLETVDSGYIAVGGKSVGYRRAGNDLHELSARQVAFRRREIGMVFQRFNLFPHMTALQNVMAGPRLVKRVDRNIATEDAMTLLRRVGLEDKARLYPNQLSGGQQQRVAIARALAMRPKVMLFDEPTSALDPELVGEVLDAMRDLTKEGITMVVVTHEIGFARDFCQTIAFMDKGQVVEAGHADELVGKPSHPRTRAFLSRLG
jgi:polar amino acid transport system ATP-binding protein